MSMRRTRDIIIRSQGRGVERAMYRRRGYLAGRRAVLVGLLYGTIVGSRRHPVGGRADIFFIIGGTGVRNVPEPFERTWYRGKRISYDNSIAQGDNGPRSIFP